MNNHLMNHYSLISGINIINPDSNFEKVQRTSHVFMVGKVFINNMLHVWSILFDS